MKPLLSIIIPIYNEDRIAADSLPPIFSLPIKKEVIVINDGSSDRTPQILSQLQKKYEFQLINQAGNQGKGAAIRRGLKEISGDYFIICDADGEYDAADIPRLFKQIKKEDDRTAVYGSRFLNKPRLSFHRLVNGFLTVLTNILFGSRLSDMETCFKMMPASALKEIELNGDRFEIEPIITAQLLKNGYSIKETPISYRRRSYKDGKKISPRDGLIAVITLFKQRFN